MATLLAREPARAEAMFTLLHRTFGNRFVAEVLASQRTVAPTVTPANTPGTGDLGSTDEPELDLSSQANAAPAKTTHAPASKNDLADADNVLKMTPVGTRGPTGTAAFIMAAVNAGFVHISYEPARLQLQQFIDNTSNTIHSKEGVPNKAKEDAGKKTAAKRGIKIEGTAGSYDVEIAESTILTTLAGLVRTRIERWCTAGIGKKRVVLSMGMFVRGDPGYGGSVHTTGSAIDTAFIANGGTSEEQAIAMVQDLPAGPRKMVFPDGAGVHVNNHGNGYDLGFSIDFFTMPWLDQVKDAKVSAEGADHSATLTAEGLVWGSTLTGISTARWDDKKGWAWSEPTLGTTSAETLLKSARLKAALAGMGKATVP